MGASWAATLGQDAQHPMGLRTLNLRFAHWKPAASGIFAVLVHGLGHPLQGVANLGIRPSLDPNDVNGGRVLLETHCLHWPAAWAPRGRTVKSSAWNCCTNCTTN
jgi:riboflavin kinase/FMN adenylyltransferase